MEVVLTDDNWKPIPKSVTDGIAAEFAARLDRTSLICPTCNRACVKKSPGSHNKLGPQFLNFYCANCDEYYQ